MSECYEVWEVFWRLPLTSNLVSHGKAATEFNASRDAKQDEDKRYSFRNHNHFLQGHWTRALKACVCMWITSEEYLEKKSVFAWVRISLYANEIIDIWFTLSLFMSTCIVPRESCCILKKNKAIVDCSPNFLLINTNLDIFCLK